MPLCPTLLKVRVGKGNLLAITNCFLSDHIFNTLENFCIPFIPTFELCVIYTIPIDLEIHC